MPLYLYECRTCAHKQNARRAIEQRNWPEVCEECGGESTRELTSPQLNTRPFFFEDANKFAFGRSETERTETFKKHDKMYARNHK